MQSCSKSSVSLFRRAIKLAVGPKVLVYILKSLRTQKGGGGGGGERFQVSFSWVCAAGPQNHHQLQSIFIAFHDYFDYFYSRNQFLLHPHSIKFGCVCECMCACWGGGGGWGGGDCLVSYVQPIPW